MNAEKEFENAFKNLESTFASINGLMPMLDSAVEDLKRGAQEQQPLRRESVTLAGVPCLVQFFRNGIIRIEPLNPMKDGERDQWFDKVQNQFG